MALPHRTFLPGERLRSIDPDRDRVAPGCDLERVPFSNRLAPLGAVTANEDLRGLVLVETRTEEIAKKRRFLLVRNLDLMPVRAVDGSPDVGAAVVVLFPLGLAETPFEVKYPVGEFPVVEQHLLDADAVAQQPAALDFPGVLGVQL